MASCAGAAVDLERRSASSKHTATNTRFGIRVCVCECRLMYDPVSMLVRMCLCARDGNIWIFAFSIGQICFRLSYFDGNVDCSEYLLMSKCFLYGFSSLASLSSFSFFFPLTDMKYPLFSWLAVSLVLRSFAQSTMAFL